MQFLKQGMEPFLNLFFLLHHSQIDLIFVYVCVYARAFAVLCLYVQREEQSSEVLPTHPPTTPNFEHMRMKVSELLIASIGFEHHTSSWRNEKSLLPNRRHSMNFTSEVFTSKNARCA